MAPTWNTRGSRYQIRGDEVEARTGHRRFGGVRGWRLTRAGTVLIVLILAAFALGTVTGSIFFFAVGGVLVMVVVGGAFTSAPAGEGVVETPDAASLRQSDSLGNVVPPPEGFGPRDA